MMKDASARQSAEGTLVLEDGSEFRGTFLGNPASTAGEVVFNTAMEGYVETLTDPSFCGQILVSTYPLVGNYGVPSRSGARTDDGRTNGFQSSRVQIQALVLQSPAMRPSHHAAAQSLAQWLQEFDVPMLHGVDTRALTQKLRGNGTMFGWLVPPGMSLAQAKQQARAVDMEREVFRRVTDTEIRTAGSGEKTVVLVDVGTKAGILDCLARRKLKVMQVPWWHSDLARLLDSTDGAVISNGPGDPAHLDELAQNIRAFLGRRKTPLLGVCMGHQVLSRALGLSTYKLPFGHRGVNQPVQDVLTGRCYVTSQNHGYAVDDRKLPADVRLWLKNLNDGTNEGIRLVDRPVRSVQFHPEGMPGPHDTAFVFDEFAADVLAATSTGARI